MARAVEKYLEGWAEPEVEVAGRIGGEYARALVVPVCNESSDFLLGYEAAVRAASGRTLCIAVVNGRANADAETHRRNREVLEVVALRASRVTDVFSHVKLAHFEKFDVLLVDRASPRWRFDPEEGVGLARKIGCDVALALHARGRSGRWIFSTDADATLPRDYFALGDVERERTALVTVPFWHAPAEDPAVTRATILHEIWLRYYVAGLAWAGSPYAVHTIGSALAIASEAYAAVRGYPKRLAGEDFYLINKAAKVGAVVRRHGASILLQSRRSDRTPFGTGRGVERIVSGGGEPAFYDPGCFRVLARALSSLDAFCRHRDVGRFFGELDSAEEASSVMGGVFERFGARRALHRLKDQTPQPALRRAVHNWFDAFRTLKLIHAARDAAFPDAPMHVAAQAPFVSCRSDERRTLDAVRQALFESEGELPTIAGPACLR